MNKKSTQTIVSLQRAADGGIAAGRPCAEWTYEGKASAAHRQVAFDGISARYPGSVHDGVRSKRTFHNVKPGGTAGAFFLLSL